MPFNCSKCKKQTCLKDGKPCDRIEKLLPKPYTGRMKKGEHSFDPHVLDSMEHSKPGWERAGGGWRKKPSNLSDYE